MSDGSYAATTWEVQFKLTEVRSGSIPYKLRIATASANAAAIQVTSSSFWDLLYWIAFKLHVLTF